MSDLARSDTKFRVPLTLCDQKRITPYNTDTFSRYKATRKWKNIQGIWFDETRNSQNQNCNKSMEHGSENCKFESEGGFSSRCCEKTTNPICKLHDILLTESFFISVVSRVQEQIGQFMRIMLETWDYNIVNNDFKWPGQSDLKEEKKLLHSAVLGRF